MNQQVEQPGVSRKAVDMQIGLRCVHYTANKKNAGLTEEQIQINFKEFTVEIQALPDLIFLIS